MPKWLPTRICCKSEPNKAESATSCKKPAAGWNSAAWSYAAIGFSLDTAVFLTDTILDQPVPELSEVSIENRPKLALLQKQVEACKQQSKMVLGDMLPTAGLALVIRTWAIST